MSKPDLNLLVALDALLTERSVVGAARRLGLSVSATRRALARLRNATGDPLLIRAGRGLVPTPRALEFQERVALLVQEAQAVLDSAEFPDLTRLVRIFTLRCGEGFAENIGPNLVARAGREAPGVRLRLIQIPDGESMSVHDGKVDLETGVVAATFGPDLHKRTLFRDRFMGVVRKGHPLSKGGITAAQYASARHIIVSREGLDRVPIDEALASMGLKRKIAAIVGSCLTAIDLVRNSDLIATVPERLTVDLRDAMDSFPLPVQVPEIPVAMLWHPMLDADPAHRWLRGLVLDICRTITE